MRKKGGNPPAWANGLNVEMGYLGSKLVCLKKNKIKQIVYELGKKLGCRAFGPGVCLLSIPRKSDKTRIFLPYLP